jgi:hypothetical protein
VFDRNSQLQQHRFDLERAQRKLKITSKCCFYEPDIQFTAQDTKFTETMNANLAELR